MPPGAASQTTRFQCAKAAFDELCLSLNHFHHSILRMCQTSLAGVVRRLREFPQYVRMFRRMKRPDVTHDLIRRASSVLSAREGGHAPALRRATGVTQRRAGASPPSLPESTQRAPLLLKASTDLKSFNWPGITAVMRQCALPPARPCSYHGARSTKAFKPF